MIERLSLPFFIRGCPFNCDRGNYLRNTNPHTNGLSDTRAIERPSKQKHLGLFRIATHTQRVIGIALVADDRCATI